MKSQSINFLSSTAGSSEASKRAKSLTYGGKRLQALGQMCKSAGKYADNRTQRSIPHRPVSNGPAYRIERLTFGDDRVRGRSPEKCAEINQHAGDIGGLRRHHGAWRLAD